MTRLTRSDIELNLLAGKAVVWKDANDKSASITLENAKQRRLLSFLLKSKIREAKGLSQDFIRDIALSYNAEGDPAANLTKGSGASKSGGPWKIQSIEIEGFGGVNAWKGAPMNYAFDGASLLLEGPNGSGKSSFTAAIIWALTGERPRDQEVGSCHDGRPVYGADDKLAGDWPSVATYPQQISDLKLPLPLVSAELVFSDPSGALAKAKRTFDGKAESFNIDPALNIPSILLESGLLMPSRLPQLRLTEGRGRLTEAVQKLTGLDDLIDLGTFVQGLCHGSRDYLSYKTSDLADARRQFDLLIEQARTTLTPVLVVVPNFKPSDTDKPDGEMAVLGRTLTDKAAELTKNIASDLAAGLDLANAQNQKQVGLALAGAEQDFSDGLDAIPAWKALRKIASALDAPGRQKIVTAVEEARSARAAALEFHEKEQRDNRYRLKAAGAQWHALHNGDSEVHDCPLCTTSLAQKPELQRELSELKNAGEAATRRLSDNLNAILIDLENVTPAGLKMYLSEALTSTPNAWLVYEIKEKFVSSERYTKFLAKCGSLVEKALLNAPTEELAAIIKDTLAANTEVVMHRIAKLEALCSIAGWFEKRQGNWESWWSDLTDAQMVVEKPVPDDVSEPIRVHLARLSNSLGDAEPYRLGAEGMRAAWKHGKIAYEIEKEQTARREIAESLSPLKSLGNLAEAQARTAINELSDRIGRIHKATYLADNLQFHKAALEKKAGLIVRGKFSDEIRIDATLVANTSWLRGVLWAFIFALREEAVEQIGSDPFPILVFDDPQHTFDSEHRHRWAEQVAKMQKGTPGIQLLLATHDELFLSLLEVDGITGRRTLISSAGEELGHIGLFEGDALDRRWLEVQQQKTPTVAQDYLAAMRKYIEGMLRLMLRGEDLEVSAFVIGACREKISVLHNSGAEPWNRTTFKSLATLLGKTVPEIRSIEMAHHAYGSALGMAEAVDFQRYWKKSLRSAVERAFRIVREHRALHGGLTALHAMPASVVSPEGYKAVLRNVQLPLVGTAAALSNGMVADGCVHLTISGTPTEMIELKDHVVFQITDPTLEPVARPGDLLLVCEHTPPSAKSLVVAMNEDRLLARRLEIADNHSDVAVLTANAINPRMIAAPVVARLTTLSLRKIVGVIFNHGKSQTSRISGLEVCDCGGESYVKAAFSEMQGLVEVNGHSAEPHALDKQFLIIGKPMAPPVARTRLEGLPVIAEDSTGSRYFKRFRGGDSEVILESLEIGGDFAPVVLADSAGPKPHIEMVWPVLGVLFEKPR